MNIFIGNWYSALIQVTYAMHSVSLYYQQFICYLLSFRFTLTSLTNTCPKNSHSVAHPVQRESPCLTQKSLALHSVNADILIQGPNASPKSRDLLQHHLDRIVSNVSSSIDLVLGLQDDYEFPEVLSFASKASA